MKRPANDVLRIGPLRPEDLSFALRLTRANGWNQRAADWRRFLALDPGGCRRARLDGRRAGTTVCCAFGPVAWLAMVLVDERFRGRGIGKALVEDGLRRADRRGCATVRLDATALGRPLYERAGFAPQFEVRRWSGTAAAASDAPPAAGLSFRRARGPADRAAIAALDRAATRTDRRPLLRRLYAESAPWIAVADGERIAAFLFRRPGRIAAQIGPAAGEAEAGAALLWRALARAAGRRVFLDLPAGRGDLEAIAAAAGLAVARNFVRMCRGAPVREDPALFLISSGPELG